MPKKSVVIVDLNERRRASKDTADGQNRSIAMFVQALEARSISVTRAPSALEAITLIRLVRPDLLVIDPAIPDGFTATDYATTQGVEVIAMTESDIMLNRARSRGISQVVVKADGWDSVMDAVLITFGEDTAAPPSGVARILVADAAQELTSLISQFLQGRGFSVATASTRAECIEILETDPTIEAVVLDVVLPKMGGLEVLQRLSRWQAPPSIIMMNSITDREIARSASRLGAFHLMTKPLNLSALETHIAACVAYSEFRAQPWWKRVTGGSTRGN